MKLLGGVVTDDKTKLKIVGNVWYVCSDPMRPQTIIMTADLQSRLGAAAHKLISSGSISIS